MCGNQNNLEQKRLKKWVFWNKKICDNLLYFWASDERGKQWQNKYYFFVNFLWHEWATRRWWCNSQQQQQIVDYNNNNSSNNNNKMMESLMLFQNGGGGGDITATNSTAAMSASDLFHHPSIINNNNNTSAIKRRQRFNFNSVCLGRKFQKSLVISQIRTFCRTKTNKGKVPRSQYYETCSGVIYFNSWSKP